MRHLGSTISMNTVDNLENVLSLHRDQTGRNSPSDVERAATNIVFLLQQAADVARRNEDRAKAQAHHYYQRLQTAEAEIKALEGELQRAEQRAVDAEQWIQRIFHSVKETLLEPLMARSEAGHRKG
jgi:predicted  nucleic acid-binding Zn-ribbon protein